MFAEKTIETGASSGTSVLTLGTAVPGWKTWRSQFADTSPVFYMAEIADGTIWEAGYGVLTYGSPDTITGRTLLLSSTGALVDFNGATVYVMSTPAAAASSHVLQPLASTRPGWLRAGAMWLDYTLGLAVTWVKKRATSSVAGGDVEEGRFDVAKAIYTPSPRRPWTATGTSGKTIAAADVGGIFTFNNAAASRAMTLPALSAVDHGFMVGGLGLTGVGGYGIVLTPNGSDAIESGTAGATRVIPGGVRFDVMKDGATGTWRVIYLNTMPLTGMGRRQTVVGGPVDGTTGLPSFLPSTNGALSITTQNVAIGTPLVASAANGFGLSGPNDSVGFASTNFSWTGLTASRAAATPNFLYGTIANGVITPASTIVAPVYQWGGTPGVTSGLITFNIGEMKAYLGNGSAAVQTNLVLFGEAATDGSGVISTVAYAYNGQYDSGWTATLTNAGVSKNHNIGAEPSYYQTGYVIQNTTTDLNYAVGDTLAGPVTQSNTTEAAVPLYATRNTVGLPALASHLLPNKTATTNGALTVGNWKYKFTADRGW
jgi:hypothetical protein